MFGVFGVKFKLPVMSRGIQYILVCSRCAAL